MLILSEPFPHSPVVSGPLDVSEALLRLTVSHGRYQRLLKLQTRGIPVHTKQEVYGFGE